MEISIPELIPYRKGDKWGFCTVDKKIVIDCKYDGVGKFSEDFAVVYKDGKCGFIDKDGIIRIPYNYKNACHFIDVIAIINNGIWQGYGFIDKNGIEIIPLKYSEVYNFSEDCTLVKKGKYGYINRAGEQITKLIYDDAFFFKDGIASVCVDYRDYNSCLRYGCINNSGEQIVELVYKDEVVFSGGFAAVKHEYQGSGFIDARGEIVIPFDYDFTSNFSDGLAKVGLKSGYYAFIDESNSLIIDLTNKNRSRSPHESVNDFTEG